MPLLSVVLPVYRVAGYLRECLDSIISQTFEDFEVIAVDDCSPDNSGAILDEYAQRDPRVRVTHLPDNVGLGGARNAAMAEATGDYVWFVDSDDVVTDGAFKAIARRLRETAPDVLFVDHAKLWMSGWTKRSTMRRRLRVADWEPDGVPQVYSPAEHPEVLRPLHTAWSRIMRRRYLLDLGVTFSSHWYEDVSYVFPVTAAATRVSVLYRVCYHYRQARQGSITGARGDNRHFEIFDEYDRVFATMDRLHVTDPAVRAEMFTRMQWHMRWVLNQTDRVPRARRREYFTRLASAYRAHRPDGYRPIGRVEAVKQRLVERDAWHAFQLAHGAKAGARGMREGLRATARTGKRTARAVLRAGWRSAMRGYYRLARLLPLDDRLAVYAAYWYRGYRCNPAAIYEKAREMVPEVRGVWVVRRDRAESMPEGVAYVIAGSPRYFRTLARARYLVNNVNFPDLYRKRAGSVFLQTHHGTPLKSMGMDQYRYPLAAKPENLPALLARSDNWDLSLSTSPFNTEVWQRCYPCRHETLEIGYPRNDRLAVATPADVAAARASLGLAGGVTSVMYAPTYREYQTAGYRPMLDVEELADELGPGYVVLARAHYFYDRSLRDGSRGKHGAGARPGAHPGVLDVTEHPDVELLYLASDVLITDYSSMMFDYAYLDRPIVIFAPDWDTYRRTRGVTFDLMAEPPGLVATTFAELVDGFVSGGVDGETATVARKEFRERFCPHIDGRSAERAVRRLFLGETDA